MEESRVVSIITQDGQGGIEAVSRVNYRAEIANINITARDGIMGSQFGVLFRPFRVASIIRGADIFVTNLPIHHMYFWLVNLFFKKHHVAVEHGPWMIALSCKSPILISWLYQYWLKKTNLPFVLVAKDLFALYSLVRKNVHYIPNAVAPISTTADAVLGSEMRKFIFVGRFDMQKDVDLCIRAFLEYSNSSEEVCTLDLFGSGAELESFKEKYAEYKSISFRGYAKDVRQRLSQYDLCLVTSRFEGLPGIVLESISSGVRVVCVPFITGLTELAEFSCVWVSSSRQPVDITATIRTALSSSTDPVKDKVEITERYSISTVRQRYRDLFREICLSQV